jgi:hypothetical protein
MARALPGRRCGCSARKRLGHCGRLGAVAQAHAVLALAAATAIGACGRITAPGPPPGPGSDLAAVIIDAWRLVRT